MRNNHLSYISNDILIKDRYTTDLIGSYFLGNKDALDLELHNFSGDKRLDSIVFSENISNEIKIYDCNLIKDKNFKICKLPDGYYLGITPINFDNKILGYVLAKKKYNESYIFPAMYDLFIIVLTIVFSIIFNFIYLFFSMKTKIEKNTSYLINFIKSKFKNTDDLRKINIDEYKTIAQTFIYNNEVIFKLEEEKRYYQTIKDISTKLAHDIRSPILTINNTVLNSFELPEHKRLLIKKATKSLNNIANNLLKEYLDSKLRDENNVTSELIFIHLINIVALKEEEYADSKIKFSLNFSKESYTCFANINLNNFERVISNLMNNSVEAIAHKNGFVSVSITCSSDIVTIIIEDNGRGISDNLISKITEQGFSYGKKHGTGLGLYYAKQQIEQLGGKLSIISRINIGTHVIIELNRSKTPIWFCEKLKINKNSRIVILDDDISVHEIWNFKLSEFDSIKILNFYDAKSLIENFQKDQNDTIYLIDYELRKNDLSGLDVMKLLSINKSSFLVTSSFDDVLLRSESEKIGVKIIPKPYIPYIDILYDAKIQTTDLINTTVKSDFDVNLNDSQIDVVVIDDDPHIYDEWKSLNNDCRFFVFSNFDEFFDTIDKGVIIVNNIHLVITDYYFDHIKIGMNVFSNGYLETLKDIYEFNGPIVLATNGSFENHHQFDAVIGKHPQMIKSLLKNLKKI